MSLLVPACRFAPSPNGALHLGHAYSALRNAAVAEACGGRLLVRMENIDVARCSPEREAAILEDLGWLGLAWQPPVRRQSEHFSLYGDALDRLATAGLTFPCFCTRRDIAQSLKDRPDWPTDPDGAPLYPGTCLRVPPAERARRLVAGEPHALRLDMARALRVADTALEWTEMGEGVTERRVPADPAVWGNAVLRRKDVPASYHIAVVVDDAAQAISDVVRGRDLFAATALHRLLQHLLGLRAPRYHHHRLVLGLEGEKLAKSRGAPALAALRQQGYTPADVRALIRRRLEAPGSAMAQGSSVVSQYR